MAGAAIFDRPERMKIALRRIRPIKETLLLRLEDVEAVTLEIVAAWDMTWIPLISALHHEATLWSR
jgi:hypothetical protein